jgi:uncharacterized protein (DUF362 family)
MSIVSLALATGHSSNAEKEAIEKSLNLLDFDFKKGVEKIVIKPNMCYYYHPSTGEVTDPRFISSLIDILREKLPGDPKIFIVESDASAMKCKYAFRMLGYDKMAKEKDVKLLNLSEEKYQVVDVEINKCNFKFYVPEILSESDLLINVPKMKYMDDVKITCALKNIYGCNAYPRKSVYHAKLNEAIVGINKLIKTDLIVVDGFVVCGKTTKRLGLVIAGRDPVAVDAAVSKLMGLKPKSIRQFVLASNERIGNLEFIPRGEPFSYLEKTFPKKGIRDRTWDTLASIYLRSFHPE